MTTKKKNEAAPKKFPVRPVKCFLCERRLYYEGDPRHAPELNLHMRDNRQTLYIHERCWMHLRKVGRGIKWPK